MRAEKSRRLAALLIPTALLALATHTLLWGAWEPHDPAHGYFGWYAPLVGALSAAGLAFLIALVLAALVGRRVAPLAALVGRLLPASPLPLGTRALQLAGSSLAWLTLQETLERSVQARGPALVALDARDLALVLVAAGVGALLLALAERGSHRLARALIPSHALPAPRRARPARLGRPRPLLVRLENPLARSLARRGPPLGVG